MALFITGTNINIKAVLHHLHEEDGFSFLLYKTLILPVTDNLKHSFVV